MFDWLHQLAHLHSKEGIIELIQNCGPYAVAAMFGIIFAETGLLVGFFLPGDSLLITAGILANPLNANHIATLNVLTLNIALVIAAIVGDQVGFYLGYKTGNKVWQWEDGKLYKKRYLKESHDFYEKWGGLAIIGARYVPIMRTFVPFAAGVAKMPYRNFVFYNIFGGVVWITSLLWIGYFLGQTPLAKRLDQIIVIVVIISILPMVIGIVKRMFFAKPVAEEAPATAGDEKA